MFSTTKATLLLSLHKSDSREGFIIQIFLKSWPDRKQKGNAFYNRAEPDTPVEGGIYWIDGVKCQYIGGKYYPIA
jgi:hypothetical protein